MYKFQNFLYEFSYPHNIIIVTKTISWPDCHCIGLIGMHSTLFWLERNRASFYFDLLSTNYINKKIWSYHKSFFLFPFFLSFPSFGRTLLVSKTLTGTVSDRFTLQLFVIQCLRKKWAFLTQYCNICLRCHILQEFGYVYSIWII